MTPSQIVVVSGSSGAGKTTTCQTLARNFDDAWFTFGFDLFASTLIPAKFGPYGERSKEFYFNIYDRDVAPGEPRMGFGPIGMRGLGAFHEMIAAAARAGQNIVVDQLGLLNPPILQDCVWRLENLPVLYVALKPPYETVHKRISERTFSIPPAVEEALGPNAMEKVTETLVIMGEWLYGASYENDIYDLVIDSSAFSPDEVVEQIAQRLRQGPGTAFDRLREIHPRPSAVPA